MASRHKVAVVLFNLGGPDSLAAVQPFLFNLFNDPAIISLPWPLRPLLARVIARRRAPLARDIYREIGGKSPLLELTREQAVALQTACIGDDAEVGVFISMRYWHPLADETAQAVRDFGPDEVVLLPLYPQFSTTTSGSSIGDWHRAAGRAGLDVPTRTVCCYPVAPGLVAAHAKLVRQALERATGPVRVLFSAHGLPKKVIEAGDPYQWQVEQTATAVVAALERPDLDWVVCYQSRVGPLEWIGPSTEDEIARGGRDGVGLIVVPIAFVSEHSETLVELDIEYGRLATETGVPWYDRVPALGVEEAFIAGLAGLVRLARSKPAGTVCAHTGERICPGRFARCPARASEG